MSFTGIIQAIYTLILIVFFLIALWAILRPVSDDIEEPDLLSIEDCESQHTKSREYKNPDLDQFTLTNNPKYSITIVNYNDLAKKIRTPEFIENFKQALLISFDIKKEIYEEKSKKVNADLRSEAMKSGFGLIDQNIKMTRLKGEVNEINKIIKSIDKRKLTLTTEQVKLGLINALHNRNDGIDSIIGRDDIKDFLAVQLHAFSESPKSFCNHFQNIVLYGPSGIGKSKLAKTIAYVYATAGILIRNKYRHITKSELTTAYVNESANLTREALNQTLEGILFIDEAYSLTPGSNLYGLGPSKDHGNEAIEEMVDFLDKNVGLNVVIAAGYKKEMESRFLGANEGMDRRFPHKLELAEYTNNQLTDILLTFIEKNDSELFPISLMILVITSMD